MADADYITADAADRARRRSDHRGGARGRQRGAVLRRLPARRRSTRRCPGITAAAGALDIYTTLDLNLQRYAQDAVRDGLARVDETLARRRKGEPRRAQAALVAVDPRTGEILAMVGGRSYNQSQFNRAVDGAPAAGLDLQAVRLSRRVRAGGRGRPRRPHAGHDGVGRADDVDLRRAGVVAAQLRGRVRRLHHAAPRAGAVAQHRDHQGRRADRLRSRSRRCGSGRASASRAAGLSVDRARRVRADAARSGHRLHAVRQRRRRSRRSRAIARVASGEETRHRPERPTGPTVARPDDDVSRHQHDAQRPQRRHRRRRARAPASRSTPPANRARPTICATRGSSASRPSCWPWSGSASTTTRRSA